MPLNPPPIPPDEEQRLAAVDDLWLLDTPPEERFDRITRTAQRLLRVPIALVTLITKDRGWYKSRQGTGVPEIDRDLSFCAYTILGDDPFVVADTHLHGTFKSFPAVLGPPHIRAYAGIALHGPGGHRVGTICVFDVVPRRFTPEEIDALADLAGWAETELGQTELAETAAQQRDTERRLRAVLDAIPEPVATFDRRGRILTMNPAGERLYGRTADELAGQRVQELLAVDVTKKVVRRVVRADPADLPVRTEVEGVRADGTRFPLEITVDRFEGSVGEFVVAARDLTERRRAEAALEALRRRQRLILDTAAEGILWVDKGGLLVFANPAARRLLGLGDADVAGVNVHERFHAFHQDGTPYPWEECPTYQTLRAGVGRRVSSEVFYRADGTQFAVDYASEPAVEDGSVVGAVLTFNDVTARREVERMKSEFVSVVSHELRTPLTSIRGSLGLLAGGVLGPLSAEAQRMADIAVSSTDRLVRLVNDILDLERMESGKFELRRDWVAVTRLLDQAVASVGGLAEEQGVAVVVETVDARVRVDGDRIVQAIANLLSNAVKFSPAGGTVVVSATVSDDVLELRVADHGRGIPAEMVERIFDRFQQLDASDSRDRGGSGLGLAIVKSIVVQHGGEVSVASAPGEGSTFTLRMPAGEGGPDAAAGGERRARGGREGRERPVVLLVEDDGDLAAVLEASLGRRGVDVAAATTQDAAVAEARQLRPDAIVLDVTLAEGDGFGVVEHLRRDRALASTPVLVYSVDDLDSHERRRLLLGPTEFLTKGNDHMHAVEAKVLELLGEPGDAPAPARRVLLVDDDHDIQAVAVLALERLGGYRVTLADSGQDGLRLARTQRPDVILLDVMMPGIDGPETLARLRQDPETASIPAVFLTAKAQTAERKKLLALAPAGILSKPFDALTLASDLARLMGWR